VFFFEDDKKITFICFVGVSLVILVNLIKERPKTWNSYTGDILANIREIEVLHLKIKIEYSYLQIFTLKLVIQISNSN
jgi:hypothetical protein